MRWLRRAAASSVVLGSLLGLPSGASAVEPITVSVELGWSCLGGTGPASSAVRVALKTPDGDLRDEALTRTDADGNWAGCFRYDEFTGLNTYVHAGDKLRVVIGGQARVIIVPDIEPTLGRLADTISGHAPAGSAVDVTILHVNGFSDGGEFHFHRIADDVGRYSVDTTTNVDLRGRDFVAVHVSTSSDHFWTGRYVPYIQVGLANSLVRGVANDGTNVEIVLTDSAGNFKGKNSGLVVDGEFNRELFREDGSRAYPVDGDWVSGNWASDGRLRMPQSYLVGSPPDDVVTGRCMANARYRLDIEYQSFSGRTDSTGRFSKYVGRRMNLVRGQSLVLYCIYPTGDVWQRSGKAG
jgi:hypothetical protein